MSANSTPSFVAQYDALRDGRGVVHLADWSSVTLTGADRQVFLHNFCTNDVKRLTPGQNCEAFFANVKGKIIGHGLITCRAGELVIIGVPAQAPRLIEHLDRYVIREDVQLRDTTAERSYLLISGEGPTREFATRGSMTPLPDPVRDRERGAETSSGNMPPQPSAAANSMRFLSWNLIGSDASGLLELPKPEVAAVVDALGDRCIDVVGSQAFDALRIEGGMPLFSVDFDDRNLPQEVGRNEQAISFTKGCYLGQETVARIDALGHVNQQLAGVRFSGTDLPEAGTPLTHDGRVVGHVTSAIHSPRLESPLALAMLRREYSAVGSRSDSLVGECEVVVLPVQEDTLRPP